MRGNSGGWIWSWDRFSVPFTRETLTNRDTRSSATAHGGAASRGSTQGNAVEVHRSLPGRSRSPPTVHLRAATRVSVRYYTTRTHPAGGLGRSIRGAGWPRSAFGMTRSDFQKYSMSEQIPNLAWNTPRKVYIPGHEILTTWVPTHLLDEMRLQRDKLQVLKIIKHIFFNVRIFVIINFSKNLN